MKFVSTVVLALLLITAVPTSAFATGSLTKKPVLIMGGCTIKAGDPTKKPWWILGGHTDKAGGTTKKPVLIMGGHTDKAEGKAKDGTPGSMFALGRRSGAAVAVSAIFAAGVIFLKQSAGMRLPSVQCLRKALCSVILSQYFEFVMKALFVAAVGTVVGGNLIEKGVTHADKAAERWIDQVDKAAEQWIDQASENLDRIIERRIDQVDKAAEQWIDQASENLDRIIERHIDQVDKAAERRIDQASENLQDIVDCTFLNERECCKQANEASINSNSNSNSNTNNNKSSTSNDNKLTI